MFKYPIILFLFFQPLIASAAMVQITQYGNQTTAAGGPNFNADLTGDGVIDISLLYGFGYEGGMGYDTTGVTINGTIFETLADDIEDVALYSIDDVTQEIIYGGAAGGTYFMPFTFTDTNYSPTAVDAILEIGILAHITDPGVHGIFLRRIIFDLDLKGTPTDYSEYEVYPEAQHVVPVPGAVWLLGSGLIGLVGIARKRKAV